MIRNILLGLVGIGILGGIVSNLDTRATYEKEVITETVEVHPEWATDTEAVEAAQAVLRRKELEAELNALESNFEALRATYEEDKAHYEEEKVRLEKEIGIY